MRTYAYQWLAVVWIATPAFPQTAVEIIQKSVDRDLNNFERQKDYTYQEQERDRDFDASGAVSKTRSETREVMILAGRPYEKVIARDGKPLDEKEARREQDKMDRALARRENMSDAEKARREKEREENRKFLKDLSQAFRFKLDGEEPVSGKPAWVIEADPNPDFKPSTLPGKVLSKVCGKVWIDKGEYQWVKAEMQVLDTISMGLALFRIAPGGSIEFEQTRVNDEVWLPSHMLIRADARIAYVKKIRTEIEINYMDYRKFQSDSKIVSVAEK